MDVWKAPILAQLHRTHGQTKEQLNASNMDISELRQSEMDGTCWSTTNNEGRKIWFLRAPFFKGLKKAPSNFVELYAEFPRHRQTYTEVQPAAQESLSAPDVIQPVVQTASDAVQEMSPARVARIKSLLGF